MKLVSFSDIKKSTPNKVYYVALKTCNGKYFPKEVFLYADYDDFIYKLQTKDGIILPFSAFAYVENGKDMFGNSDKFMITFNKYMECNEWCLNQNK